MAIQFLNSVDFNQNELFHPVIENQGSDALAGDPVAGQLYFNTATAELKVGYQVSAGPDVFAWKEVGDITGSGNEGYLSKWGTGGKTLNNSGFFQSFTADDTENAIGLNTTSLSTNYGEYPDLRVASRSDNDFSVLDLFRKDNDVTAGETVGMLQYSVLDDGQYVVAQISAETLSTTGTGDSGGGKFVFKTTSGSGSGPSFNTPESRFTLDKNSADFSVPVNVTSTAQSSFAGQVTIPLTPALNTDAASKGYVDGLVEGGLTFKGTFDASTGLITGSSPAAYLYQVDGNGAFDPTASRVAVTQGDYYVVQTAGQFYGNGGTGGGGADLDAGDSIIALDDALADSSVVTDWSIVQSDEGVVSLSSGNGAASTGNAITSQTDAVGAVTVESFAYAGAANVGHVPAGGAPTTFLRGDGAWATPVDTGALGDRVALTGGSQAGGLTTFTYDVTDSFTGAVAIDVKCEVISAAGETVYASVTRSSANLVIEFSGTIADNDYEVLLTYVG